MRVKVFPYILNRVVAKPRKPWHCQIRQLKDSRNFWLSSSNGRRKADPVIGMTTERAHPTGFGAFFTDIILKPFKNNTLWQKQPWDLFSWIQYHAEEFRFAAPLSLTYTSAIITNLGEPDTDSTRFKNKSIKTIKELLETKRSQTLTWQNHEFSVPDPEVTHARSSTVSRPNLACKPNCNSTRQTCTVSRQLLQPWAKH